MRPSYRMEIPETVWLSVAKAQTPGFADSYLYGAVLTGNRLYPRTQTGWAALKERASHTLGSLGIELVKPLPFGESGQVSATQEMGDSFKRKGRE